MATQESYLSNKSKPLAREKIFGIDNESKFVFVEDGVFDVRCFFAFVITDAMADVTVDFRDEGATEEEPTNLVSFS